MKSHRQETATKPSKVKPLTEDELGEVFQAVRRMFPGFEPVIRIGCNDYFYDKLMRFLSRVVDKRLNSISKIPDSLFGVPIVKVSEQKAPYVFVRDKERK